MIEKCPKCSGLLTRDYENELTCSLCAWHENGIGFYEWSHHKTVIIDKVFIPFTGSSRPVSSVKRIQPREKLENLFLPVISKTRTICDPKQNPECKICRPHMITKNIDEKKTKKKSKKKVPSEAKLIKDIFYYEMPCPDKDCNKLVMGEVFADHKNHIKANDYYVFSCEKNHLWYLVLENEIIEYEDQKGNLIRESDLVPRNWMIDESNQKVIYLKPREDSRLSKFSF